MELIICQKHKKIQKTAKRVLVSGQVCMNRNCPNSFVLICSLCKNNHRDHSFNILSLEDINLFMAKLIKTSFGNSNKYLTESIEILKKIKLIKDFKKKIDLLEADLLKEAIAYLNVTQPLVNQYQYIQQIITQLNKVLNELDKPETFKKLKENAHKYFSQLQYNQQKQILELGSKELKKEDFKRKKLLQITKRKIEEVKDYSMKIIEVILNQSDSDQSDGQFDTTNIKMKMYNKFKKELNIDGKIEYQFDKQQNQRDQQFSKSTTVSIKNRNMKNIKDYTDNKTQTQDKWITQLIQQSKKLRQELQKSKNQVLKMKKITTRMKSQHERAQANYKQKLMVLKQQNNILHKDIGILKRQTESQKKTFREIYQRLENNVQQKRKVANEKQQVLRKIICINTSK